MPATIVVGVDGSNDSARALDCAACIAEPIGAHLVIAFVFRAAGAATGTAGAGALWTETMNDLAIDAEVISIARLSGGGASWDFQTAVGDPAAELLAIAREHDASMLVVGRHGHPRFAGLFGRSVSERLVREADIPVLIVPHHPKGRHWLARSHGA